MTKPKRPKYENVQYTPPTPQVFGNAAPVDLPTAAPKSSFSVDRPRNRPKLQDRLAVYEDDNPRCQQILCIAGIFCPPLWLVGAIMYLRTPSSKVLAREAGFRNLMLSLISLVFVIIFLVYYLFFDGAASGPPGTPTPKPATR
mmetsp:Transcript_56582/g.165449  ORF Transcript_56582/g.165449 Transcript_56582/m.165449 type:complete len:143 (+) Transcript_56582:71-499(+)